MTTFSAGQRLTAAQLENIIAPGWTDYSSSLTLTAVTTNPTKGNSTYTSNYRRSTGSDMVVFRGRIIIGSTFSAGSGAYRLSLPVTAASGAVSNTTGSVYVLDSGTAHRVMVCNILSTTTMEIAVELAGAILGSGGPAGAGWATSDEIRWTITYQAA